MRRVVVTGLGALSPLGNDWKASWENAKKGVNGIDTIKQFDVTDFQVKIAGELKDFDVTNYLDKREAKRLDKFSQYAMIASAEAVKDANLNVDELDKNRFGVMIGSGIGGLRTIQDEHTKAMNKGYHRISPFFIPMSIANLAAGNVSIMFGANGISASVVTACAAAANSIGEGFRKIKDGYQDVIIAGGSEASINEFGIGGFMALKALNTSNDKDNGSIPFDENRSGFVMGEGSGIVILEDLEHAKKRGAKIYAEIVGYGATCDAFHVTAPANGGGGAANCMAEALKEANINPSDVDYINAHGTSTPLNDKNETLAIKTVFGEDTKVQISSTKSMTGHLLGASGGIEAIFSIMSIVDNFIAPTINHNNPDPECDLDYVPNVGRETEVNVSLTNSLGFGGHNATLVFKKFEE
ncbi:beta-ketoacyl-ACP synthase II [Mycoplasmatota bacterium WC44]